MGKNYGSPSVETKLIIAKEFNIPTEKILNDFEINQQNTTEQIKKKIQQAFLLVLSKTEKIDTPLTLLANECSIPVNEIKKVYPNTRVIFYQMMENSYKIIQLKIVEGLHHKKLEPISYFSKEVLPIIHSQYTLFNFLYTKHITDLKWTRTLQKMNEELCQTFFENQQIENLVHDRTLHIKLVISMFFSFIKSWMELPIYYSLEEVQDIFETFSRNSLGDLLVKK